MHGRYGKTWRPLFRVGDHVRFADHVPTKAIGPSLHKDSALVIARVEGRKRAGDRRPNRYLVHGPRYGLSHREPPPQGWFYEDDLERA